MGTADRGQNKSVSDGSTLQYGMGDGYRLFAPQLPPLGAAERTSWGRGIRRFGHWSIMRGPVGLTSMCVETVFGTRITSLGPKPRPPRVSSSATRAFRVAFGTFQRRLRERMRARRSAGGRSHKVPTAPPASPAMCLLTGVRCG